MKKKTPKTVKTTKKFQIFLDLYFYKNFVSLENASTALFCGDQADRRIRDGVQSECWAHFKHGCEKKNYQLFQNFKFVLDVVSNEMIFDENENVTAFTEPLIHTFTKNTQSIGETWRKKLHERKNVLLMGKLIRVN